MIAFFFCYSPFHAQRVIATVMERNQLDDNRFIQIYTILTHISGVTYYLSSTINPILYQVMSKKFQLALRETLSCCCQKLQDDNHDLDYAFSTVISTTTPKQTQSYSPNNRNNNNSKNISTIYGSSSSPRMSSG